jgi:hypothetical protein
LLFDQRQDATEEKKILFLMIPKRRIWSIQLKKLKTRTFYNNYIIFFKFLDQGRNRRDERAWAIMHANICYIKDNEELMTALVKPQWEKRKE